MLPPSPTLLVPGPLETYQVAKAYPARTRWKDVSVSALAAVIELLAYSDQSPASDDMALRAVHLHAATARKTCCQYQAEKTLMICASVQELALVDAVPSELAPTACYAGIVDRTKESACAHVSSALRHSQAQVPALTLASRPRLDAAGVSACV